MVKLFFLRKGFDGCGNRSNQRHNVKGVEKGEIVSTVRIEVAIPAVITAMITQEAVEELGLKEGDAVEAVIKATEILVLKE
ncbi:hypothetical protein C5S32_06235 [ANME-1 cluster archaeon GoMg1]|nr:hypothetical protein [ANME-1 cluster archaeon GoMg1]